MKPNCGSRDYTPVHVAKAMRRVEEPTSRLASALEKYAMGIIVGGALGNFYDRIIYKSVPDFIDIHYNNFHWFTFNVADIFISFGIIFFFIIPSSLTFSILTFTISSGSFIVGVAEIAKVKSGFIILVR